MPNKRIFPKQASLCVEARLVFCMILVLCTITIPTRAAVAAVLVVGPGQKYPAPSDAARAAQPGDTVRIQPGTYFDCAVWTTNNLTIEGAGPGTVLADKICQGKAIFVIAASNTTVRGLTFTRARSNDGNGAGIRAEGVNLKIENSAFTNNENGILAGDNPRSSITIRRSEFIHNGACPSACAHGVYVGHIALLQIEQSRFYDTQAGHHVKSRAEKTILTRNQLVDGPGGTASYEVDIPNGGSLTMVGNTLEKGPKNGNHTAAILIGEEGVSQPTDQLVFKNNIFSNDGPPTAFVKNITATPAEITGATFKGKIVPLIGDGSVH